MVRKLRGLLFATVFGVALASKAGAQPGLPPAPIPATPGGAAQDGTVIAQPHVIPPQGSSAIVPSPLAAPGSAPLVQVRPGGPLVVPLSPVPPNGPVVGSPPILMPPPPPEPLPAPPAPPGRWNDRPNNPPCGWFGDVEIDVVGPHVKNRLIADVEFPGGIIDTVHLPMASLNWTGSPRFEAGYRFANNGGQFSAVYRFLTTEGRATMTDFDLGELTNLRSRLDFNVIDFAYGSGYYAPGPYSELQWRVGVRLAQAYFDTRAQDAIREERTSNHFFGVGPLGSIEWWRRLDTPGFALFGRLEGAVPLGSVHQGYEEIINLSRFERIGAATSQRQTQAVPTLSLDLGIGWTPHWSRFSRLSFGYHFEHWWDLGLVNDATADLTTQGLFFKGEFSF